MGIRDIVLALVGPLGAQDEGLKGTVTEEFNFEAGDFWRWTG